MAADTINFVLKNDATSTLNTFPLPLNKLDATAAPGVTDDDAAGYVAGSLWVDRTAHKTYICKDNATGAAVWAEIPGAGGGDLVSTNNLSDLASATTALTNLGLSANGKSLVTAADYAAMRGLLDLEAGTDFYSISAANAAFDAAGAAAAAQAASQPLDTQLTSLSGLSYGSNALKVVRVNAGETAFELAAAGAGDALVANPLSQFAATTSSQLAGVISDETGSGALVFATSPTLVTPALGAATATSINGLTITSSTGTLTVANSKTATVSNTLTFTGTDGSTLAIGTGGTLGTAAYTAATAHQPVDATLTALAGLTIAANSLTIGTGADAFSQTPFAANTFPARASTGDLVAKTVSDFALTILDDANAAAVRATIGAGTGGGDALTTNPLSQFAATTSSQLAGVISDETGSGALVFANAPALGTVTITPTATVASAAGAVWNGFSIPSTTCTVTGTTQITTAAGFNLARIAAPTITNGSAATIDYAATLAIVNSPIAAGSVTITNAYALWVQAGHVKMDGGTLYATGGAAIGSTGQLQIGVGGNLSTSSTITASGSITGSNLSGTNTGDQTTITGNAGTATALQTARSIYGSNFDGTAALAGPVGIGYGGTGATTAATARVALLPSMSGNSLKNLRVNAGETDYELSSAGSGTVTNGANLTDNVVVVGDGGTVGVKSMPAQNANKAYRGPSSGSDAVPTFRADTAADMVPATHAVGGVTNATFTATASAGALTIALKTYAGSDATAADPARAMYRSATAGSGARVERTATASASLVVPSGATLGMVSGASGKAWVLLIDDAGTPSMAITNCMGYTTSQVFPLSESMLVSTTAIGTGSDSAGVVYSTSTITAKPIKILGWVQWTTVTTAGTHVDPDKIHPWSPGDKLPGDTVAQFSNETSETSGTDSWPADSSVPVQGETFSAATIAIAAIEPSDAVEITAWAFCSASTGQFPYAGIYHGSSDFPLDWQLVGGVNNAGAGGNSRLSGIWFPGTTSSITYYYRWAAQAGTVYVSSYLGTNYCGEKTRMKARVIRT